MNLTFGNNKIPTFLIFQVLCVLVVGFIFWRKRKSCNLRNEQVFDFILFMIIFSILCGRLFYVALNFDDFKKLSWSIYPFYYEPGAERVWFRQMPWVTLKFWEGGVVPSALMLGGTIYTLLFFAKRKLLKKIPVLLVTALSLGQIVQMLGFFLSGDYMGKETSSWVGVKYPMSDNLFRVPIQFLEIAVLVAFLFLVNYLKKVKRRKGVLGIYLFIFGWLQVVVHFIKDNGEGGLGGINVIQIVYLLFVFSGILIFVFSNQNELQLDSKTRVLDRSSADRTRRSSRISDLQFGYRDFKSSFSNYGQHAPTAWGWLKRKLTNIKRNLLSRKQGDNIPAK